MDSGLEYNIYKKKKKKNRWWKAIEKKLQENNCKKMWASDME